MSANKRQWYAIKSKLERQGKWNYSKKPKKQPEKRKHTEDPDDPDEGPAPKQSKCK